MRTGATNLEMANVGAVGAVHLEDGLVGARRKLLGDGHGDGLVDVARLKRALEELHVHEGEDRVSICSRQ